MPRTPAAPTPGRQGQQAERLRAAEVRRLVEDRLETNIAADTPSDEPVDHLPVPAAVGGLETVGGTGNYTASSRVAPDVDLQPRPPPTPRDRPSPRGPRRAPLALVEEPPPSPAHRQAAVRVESHGAGEVASAGAITRPRCSSIAISAASPALPRCGRRGGRWGGGGSAFVSGSACACRDAGATPAGECTPVLRPTQGAAGVPNESIVGGQQLE